MCCLDLCWRGSFLFLRCEKLLSRPENEHKTEHVSVSAVEPRSVKWRSSVRRHCDAYMTRTMVTVGMPRNVSVGSVYFI